MSNFKVGDTVARKSYGGDVFFQIVDVASRSDGKKIYELRGLLYRILADSHEDDLIIRDSRQVQQHMQRGISSARKHSFYRSILMPYLFSGRVRGRPGKILHIDSSADFLDMCFDFYKQSKVRAVGKIFPESEQPGHIRELLESTNADILIVTGHDGIKKNVENYNSVDSYRNSKYYIQSVKEARKYQPSLDRLCVFAGACQSYFEGLMAAGANFASSPGRVLIHALDPGKVGERVALTDSRVMVTPRTIAGITKSGSKGISGIDTRGHFKVE